MIRVLLFVFFCSVFSSPLSDPKAREWWETTSVYQIYPRSFKDSNNDGIGDLKGIQEKLSYLKDTGLETVWLSPIYPSPMVDFGYDISDFIGISSDYGTMADFDDLLAEAHRLGLKLVLDFVPNHSSDKHEWFQKSANKEPGYEDYYVWRDPKGFDSDGKPIPPNNWLSIFYGSAWEYHAGRKQFYLHQFAKEQPDLNYANPKLVEEMKNVVRFWLEKGVDGFRVDAVPFLFEDVRELDEPPNYPLINDTSDSAYLQHIYTQHQDGTYDMIQQFREVADSVSASDGKVRCLMIEAYGDISQTMRYYGTLERPGGHFPFNFQFISANSNFDSNDFKRTVDSWMDNLPTGKRSNWVVGNHDNHRVADRMGHDLKDSMNMLALLLPGVSVTYYGEEIGMEDNLDITYDQGVDPQGCNYPPDRFQELSRDFERTPFQWDNSTNSGFNIGQDPWLPVNKNYQTLNLAAQVGKPYSHYEIYRDLQRARLTTTIQEGNLLSATLGRNTFGFVRGLNSSKYFIVLINLDQGDDTLDLDSAFLLGNVTNLTVYTASENSGLKKGSVVNSQAFALKARSCVVLSVGQTS